MRFLYRYLCFGAGFITQLFILGVIYNQFNNDGGSIPSIPRPHSPIPWPWPIALAAMLLIVFIFFGIYHFWAKCRLKKRTKLLKWFSYIVAGLFTSLLFFDTMIVMAETGVLSYIDKSGYESLCYALILFFPPIISGEVIRYFLYKGRTKKYNRNIDDTGTG